MRTSGLALAAVLTLAPGIAVAQGSWGNVKTWKGTVTVEATDVQKREGAALTLSATMTYKATGEFTISDDMLPDGSHMQWPMPSVEAMSDPKRAETVYDRWQSQVVVPRSERTGREPESLHGQVHCRQPAAGPRSVSPSTPTEPKYFVEVSPPMVHSRLGDSGRFPNGRLPQASSD
jgi:hypothetical protein